MLKPKLKKNSAGFSLIEVLVATVVMALAVLGFAALQITGLANNKVAMERTQASMLAYAITDAMRANRVQAIADSYDHPMSAASPSGSSMADKDIAAWLSTLSVQLPSGMGSVAVDPTTGVATIIVQWNENKATTPSQFLLNTRL